MSAADATAPSDRVKSGSTLPLYLTPKPAAELLDVSVKTISRWSIEDPSMPAFKRGRVVRFPRAELLAWIARQMPRKARSAARTTQGSGTAP